MKLCELQLLSGNKCHFNLRIALIFTKENSKYEVAVIAPSSVVLAALKTDTEIQKNRDFLFVSTGNKIQQTGKIGRRKSDVNPVIRG